jgi:hypothetical protein
MHFDFSMRVADAQAVTGSLAASTGFYDAVTSFDPGEGKALLARATIATAFTGSGTMRIAIAGTNGGTWGLAALGGDGVVYGATDDLPLAALYKNAEFFIRLAPISPPQLPAPLAVFGNYTGQAGVTGGGAAVVGRRLLGGVFVFSPGATLTGNVTIDFVGDSGSFAKTYPKSYSAGIA